MTIDELLAYTAGERDKWQRWFESQTPAALVAAVQREGDFNDVWRLMHHIFLVEKRHTQRLKQESPLMEQIGVARHNVSELFSFGRAVRAEFMEFIRSASDTDSGPVIGNPLSRPGRHVQRAQARVPYALP
jgi:DinB family